MERYKVPCNIKMSTRKFVRSGSLARPENLVRLNGGEDDYQFINPCEAHPASIKIWMMISSCGRIFLERLNN